MTTEQKTKRKGGKGHHETETDAQIATRRKIVGANLLAGVDYRTMAQSLNVSVGTIASDVKALLSEWRDERVRVIDEFKQLHLTRLDVLLNGLWDKARNGDANAIRAVMEIMDRQARIMGIDIARVAVSAERMSDDEAKRILAGAVGVFGGAGEFDQLQDADGEGVSASASPATD